MSTMGDTYVLCNAKKLLSTNYNTLFLRFPTIVRRNHDYKTLTFFCSLPYIELATNEPAEKAILYVGSQNIL